MTSQIQDSPNQTAEVVRRAMGLRYVLLAFGGVSLILGMNFGLALLGIETPLAAGDRSELHAQLMVFGFLGTLIALERAIAVRQLLAFVAPAGFGLGALLLIAGVPQQFGEALQVVGALGLVWCYRLAWKRVPSASLAIQALGAVLAVGAAVLWLGGTQTQLVAPWICAFIILTIVGERLDLARLNISSARAESWAVGFAVAAAIGATSSLLWPVFGLALFGSALLALVGWLVQYDIVTKTIRMTGLPRYTAACLLSGYAWLALAGIFWIAADPATSAGLYDLTIHAVFIGFALSMVLGHAPIILPAVLGRPLPYRTIMWLPLIILQLSLIVRILVGDLRSVTWAWQIGGASNVVAILLFLIVALTSVIVGTRAGEATGRPVAPRKPSALEVGAELPVVPAADTDAPVALSDKSLLPLVGSEPKPPEQP